MGETSTARLIIVALLLSTAIMSVISVLFVNISGYSIETIYAVSFVIMQVAFFCVIGYMIIRMKEWLEGYLEAINKCMEELGPIKDGIESIRENIEMMNEKTDNIENVVCGKIS
jgi:hypothetical protein